MAKRKIVGYQITNKKCDVPEGLWSFQLFRDIRNAYKYCREHGLKGGKGTNGTWFIQVIREGDIEEPTYID